MMLKKLNQKDHVINLYRPTPVFWPIWISLDHVVMHKHQLGQDYLCCQRYTGKVYQYTVHQVGLTLTHTNIQHTAKRNNAPYTTVLEDSGFTSHHISADDVCLVAYLASQTLVVMEGIPKTVQCVHQECKHLLKSGCCMSMCMCVIHTVYAYA